RAISSTGIPSTGLGVRGTATVVNSTTNAPPGFVTLFPKGVSLPNVSNLNYLPGQIVPNAFVVGLSADGSVAIYASTAPDAVIDLTGYYDTNSSGGLLFDVLPTPVRVLD